MTPSDSKLASIRRRGVALLIDFFLLAMVFLVVGVAIDRQLDLFRTIRDTFEPREATVVVQQQVVLIVALLMLNYFPILWATKGQTLGKMMTGIRVVTTSGGRISWPRAYARFVGLLMDTALLTLGYWVAPLNPRRQTVHDLLAGTLVVRQVPVEPQPSPPYLPYPTRTTDRATIPPATLPASPAPPATVSCPSCGQQVPGNSTFCGRCGQRLG